MKKVFVVIAISFFLLNACGKKENFSGYKIGIDPNWYSIELPGKEKNLLGFSTELLREISLLKKIKLELVMTNWDVLLQGLSQKKYQGILFTLYPYAFNKEKYNFSHLYLATGPVLIVSENSNINSLEQLKGKEVAIQSGSNDEVLLQKIPGALARSYGSVPQALNDILIQRVDAALVDSLIAQAYCQDLYKGQLKIVTAPLNDQGLRLITLKGIAPKLIKEFDEGLKELQSNGKYAALAKKWSL